MESKGNVVLKSQIDNLARGLRYWHGEAGGDIEKNPLLQCDFNYLAFKLQVLGRLRHYMAIEAASTKRMKLLYLCSGSDEYCKVIESIGFSLTTLDMCDNTFSSNHVKRLIQDDDDSLRLIEELINKSDIILWDSSIGHLDENIVRKILRLIAGKVYVLGLYDVPKLESFGEKVKSNKMMANIIRNSPSTNADLYAEIMKKAKLKFSIDLGAFSLLLYDNIFEFPHNDITMARILEQANSF